MKIKFLRSVFTIILGLTISFSAISQVKVVKQPDREKQQSNTIELSDKTAEIMSKTPNFAMGVSSARRLNSALMMYETLKNNEVKFEHYEIVVWSKIVGELKEGSEWHKKMEKILDDERVKVSVCGFAMKKLKLEKKDLIPKLVPVPDAFARIYTLQAMEYNVLIP